MTLLVKGFVVLSIPSAGSWFIYKFLGDVLDTSMPPFYSLTKGEDGKFGEDYQPYLGDTENTENDKWWKWAFENKYKKITDPADEFSKDKITGSDKLKEKCKEAYAKESKDLTDTNTTDKKYKHGRDAWRFCSVFKAKPKTIKDNEESTDQDNLKTTTGAYDSKIGSTKKDELVSVTDTGDDNDLFWKMKEKEFFGEGPNGGEGTGKYETSTKGTADKKTLFDNFYDTKNERSESLKSKCSEAYQKSSSETSSTPPGPSEQEVVKFCGLKKQKTTAS